tara:strand:+ start:1068 stop:1394 length:327 start_codon:yes stop_codon:yes gene_type:complete
MPATFTLNSNNGSPLGPYIQAAGYSTGFTYGGGSKQVSFTGTHRTSSPTAMEISLDNGTTFITARDDNGNLISTDADRIFNISSIKRGVRMRFKSSASPAPDLTIGLA